MAKSKADNGLKALTADLQPYVRYGANRPAQICRMSMRRSHNGKWDANVRLADPIAKEVGLSIGSTCNIEFGSACLRLSLPKPGEEGAFKIRCQGTSTPYVLIPFDRRQGFAPQMSGTVALTHHTDDEGRLVLVLPDGVKLHGSEE